METNVNTATEPQHDAKLLVSKSCHTTEICEQRLGEEPIVHHRAPLGSKHAQALMLQVDLVSRKYGWFYRHVC